MRARALETSYINAGTTEQIAGFTRLALWAAPPCAGHLVNNTRMRVVLQRVKQASVTVSGDLVGAIGAGLAVLVGVNRSDTREDAVWLAEKVVNLRVFPDDGGRMNRSLLESGGELLVISQFTLYGDCRKGRRPDFTEAAPPEQARNLYDYFVEQLRARVPNHVTTGVFQAHMELSLTNDGPVTLVCDSIKRLVKTENSK